jgi:WD40 repeat protein
VGGRPAIFAVDPDLQVHLRDLTTDRDIVQPMPSYEADVNRVEVVAVDGRDVLVTVGFDGQVRTVDLPSGRSGAVGVHDGVWAVAAASAGGVSIAATNGLNDGIVRRWDLRTGGPLGEPLPLPEASETGATLSTASIDGRLCLAAQAVSRNLTVVWDGATGEQVARTNATGEITVLGGVPVLVNIVQGIAVADLRTGAVIRRHPTDSAIGLRPSAVALLDGRPVLAIEGERNTIVIRDLDTGQQLGAPIEGHQAALTKLGVADLNGRPVLVSAARDNAIRVWDLAVRAAG